EQFEGPLDLLLDEVRRQRVAIENVALAPVVARYLEYVRTAAAANLHLDIEWLHIAAILIQWKSRALLPEAPGGLAHPDPIREDLIQQMLVYAKQVSNELAERRAVEEKRYSRPVGAGTGEAAAIPEETRFLSVWDLVQQARDLARWVEQHRQARINWRESLGME